MSIADERQPPDKPGGDDKDLFGKLDQLINRHQTGAARSPSPAAVPTLTESVEPQAPVPAAQIPVLSEAVELPPVREAWPGPDRRRQLQVALYLRLRQRLDRELDAVAPNREPGKPESELARVVHALRNTLPAIVRESVDQVFGSDSAAPGRRL